MRKRVYLLLLLLIPAVASAAPANRLADHPSAYLALHGADPVAWQTWGEEAVAQARQTRRLLFVSSGYFACHWCHVMQRESYQDPAIAALLNANFVSVKVDRELEPALDTALIDFVQRTRGHAGWPLNVFVTPDGYPLLGFVYLPPAEFLTVAEGLARRWREDAEALRAIAQEAAATLSPAPATGGPYTATALQQAFLADALGRADDFEGGFGQQSKFPSVPQLRALQAAAQGQVAGDVEGFLRLTLEQMAGRGLRDHLGGGFFRYAVDPGWMVPHFEKMLYDNAQLAALYLDAARIWGDEGFERVGRETLDFMLRELELPRGGFAGSLSALDDRAVEGGYYLWTAAELRRHLSAPERAVAELAWDLAGPPALEHGHHLTAGLDDAAIAERLALPPGEAGQLREQARRKLLDARHARALPRDDKFIAAWNGLALGALARGATLPDGGAYRQAGARLRGALVRDLWDGQTLARAATADGARLAQGTLEDYVLVAWGLWEWAKVTNSAADAALAERLVREAWQRFRGDDQWYLAQRSLMRYGEGHAVLPDGPLPAASATLKALTLSMGARTGDLHARVRESAALGHETLLAQPFEHATHITFLLGPYSTAD